MIEDSTLIFILLLVTTISVSCFFYPCNLKKEEHFANKSKMTYDNASEIFINHMENLNVSDACIDDQLFCIDTYKTCSTKKNDECKSALKFCIGAWDRCLPKHVEDRELKDSMGSEYKDEIKNATKIIMDHLGKTMDKNLF